LKNSLTIECDDVDLKNIFELISKTLEKYNNSKEIKIYNIQPKKSEETFITTEKFNTLLETLKIDKI